MLVLMSNVSIQFLALGNRPFHAGKPIQCSSVSFKVKCETEMNTFVLFPTHGTFHENLIRSTSEL